MFAGRICPLQWGAAGIGGHRLGARFEEEEILQAEGNSYQTGPKVFHSLLVFLRSYKHHTLFILLSNFYQQRKPSKNDMR